MRAEALETGEILFNVIAGAEGYSDYKKRPQGNLMAMLNRYITSPPSNQLNYSSNSDLKIQETYGYQFTVTTEDIMPIIGTSRNVPYSELK